MDFSINGSTLNRAQLPSNDAGESSPRATTISELPTNAADDVAQANAPTDEEGLITAEDQVDLSSTPLADDNAAAVAKEIVYLPTLPVSLDTFG